MTILKMTFMKNSVCLGADKNTVGLVIRQCVLPQFRRISAILYLVINNHNSFVVFAACISFALVPVALSGQSFPNTFSTGESS